MKDSNPTPPQQAATQEPSDEALMRAYVAGDREAFETLYHRYAPRVYGFLKKRVSHRDTVEELFQLIFLKLHQSRERYDAKFPFAPWLFTLSRNVVIDHFRRRRLETVQVPNEATLDALTYTDPPSEPTQELNTKQAMKTLSNDQQKAIQLRYDEAFSFEEIAQQLGVTPTTARKRVSRAIARLRSFFAPTNPPGGQNEE